MLLKIITLIRLLWIKIIIKNDNLKYNERRDNNVNIKNVVVVICNTTSSSIVIKKIVIDNSSK